MAHLDVLLLGNAEVRMALYHELAERSGNRVRLGLPGVNFFR